MFTFNNPAFSTTNPAPSDRILRIRNLQIAAPFEGRLLVYRTGEFSYEDDPYAEFLESPAEGLVVSVREWLRGHGGFSDVVDSGSVLKANMLVEISVSQLFGDFRRPEYPVAVMTMRFVFLDAQNGVPGKA